MKKLTIGLLAAAGIAMAIPAHADGFWVGAGPFGVGIGAGPGYYDGPHGYYDHDYVYYDHDYVYGRYCRTVLVDDGYGLRRIHRCY